MLEPPLGNSYYSQFIKPAQVVKERSQIMLALAENAQNFREQFLGTVRPVLWKKPSGGIWSGLTDNYIKVYIRSDEDLTNKLLPV